MIESQDRRVRLTEETIHIGEDVDFLRAAEGGAVNLFLGTTRRITDSRETESLSYEAAPTLAVRELDKLIDAASSRWNILRAVLVHRTGLVPVSDISVFIGVATAHRKESFEATRFLIDELKKSVPIWKKELFTDGSSEWAEGEHLNL